MADSYKFQDNDQSWRLSKTDWQIGEKLGAKSINWGL